MTWTSCIRSLVKVWPTKLAELLGTTEQTVSLWERGRHMPKAYDRLVRAIYLESIEGNVKLQALIQRLIAPDQKDTGKIVLEDVGSGWRKAA